jgi:hypothetical protein
MTKSQAIKTIEECRDIHQGWVDHDALKNQMEHDIGGDKDWHEKWVKKYNGVLEILRAGV